jgi:hypothetical protein
VPLPKADLASDVARSKESLSAGLLTDHSHAATTTAEGSFDNDREAILSVNSLTSSYLSTGPGVPGTTGHLALDGQLTRRDLVA